MHGALVTVSEEMIPFVGLAADVIWRALLCHSGQERAACNWLRMRQLHPYWPRYRVEPTRIQASQNVRWRNVLSGYLFLPVPNGRSIDTDYLECCPGVWDIMRNGPEVAVLTEADIASVRRLEEAMQNSIAAKHGVPFKIGEKVRVVGFEIYGKVVEIISRDKILIEAQFFGSSKRVMEIGSAGLRAI